MSTTRPTRQLNREGLDQDLFWYKTGVIYELHVRAYCDSDGNGVGDFQGLTSKLDYLKDLGVTALWLLPFYPSPLRDDGYDIADYYEVHPNYGTLADFKVFLREAHQRGLRVITELVMNHTSDQHAWFQRARRAKPGGVAWRHITGAGLIGGVGFTVSLFISGLAFSETLLIEEAKVGVLAASIIAALGGYLFLLLVSRGSKLGEEKGNGAGTSPARLPINMEG